MIDMGGHWYRPAIDQDLLTSLSARSNRPATISTGLWLAGIAATATAVVLTWGTWWVVAALIAHAVFACGAADARWHECGHGTAFASERANTVIYHLASFLLLREPTVWRWSHARHHSETIMVGRDPEIAFGRPTRPLRIVADLFHLYTGPRALVRLVRHAFGRIDPIVAGYTPASEYGRVRRDARASLGIRAAIVITCVVTRSVLPAVLLGLPAFYGAWMVVFFGATQHAGLDQNVLDHRLSTRSVRMNRFFRFLYLDMNHHLEHHLFPVVPYHRLADLQAALAPQLPPPAPSTWAAYREILPALARQYRDPSYALRPALPAPCEPPAAAPIRSLASVEIDSLRPGQLCAVMVDGKEQVLCRISTEEWVLAPALCTHGEARLAEGVVQGHLLECPRHNGRFDLHTGAAVRRPAVTALEVRPWTPAAPPHP